jgi:peptide/nickel transport system permease protein
VRAYLLRRLLHTLLVLLGVSSVSFGVMYLSGDPASIVASPDWTQREYAEFRRQWGLDRPWHEQYGSFVLGLVQGDWGTSIRQRDSNLRLITERLPATLELTAAATMASIVVGIPLGTLAAVSRGRAIDRLSMLVALIGQSVPNFWLGTLLLLVFGVMLGWLPVSGHGGLEHLVLPTIALSAYNIARNARLMRSAVLEVLGLDHVRTAHSKGLAAAAVVRRHVVRNALIPVVTVMALQFGALFGGAVVIETIFAWPGVGRLLFNAIVGRDFTLVTAIVTCIALIFALINLVTDVVYLYLDPRIRYS